MGHRPSVGQMLNYTKKSLRGQCSEEQGAISNFLDTMFDRWIGLLVPTILAQDHCEIFPTYVSE